MCKKISQKVLRGQIWWTTGEYGTFNSSVIAKNRPVLVISSNSENSFKSTVVVLPISTSDNCVNHYNSFYKFSDAGDVSQYVLCSQIKTIDKAHLSCYKETMSREAMEEISKAMISAFSLDDNKDCVDLSDLKFPAHVISVMKGEEVEEQDIEAEEITEANAEVAATVVEEAKKPEVKKPEEFKCVASGITPPSASTTNSTVYKSTFDDRIQEVAKIPANMLLNSTRGVPKTAMELAIEEAAEKQKRKGDIPRYLKAPRKDRYWTPESKDEFVSKVINYGFSDVERRFNMTHQDAETHYTGFLHDLDISARDEFILDFYNLTIEEMASRYKLSTTLIETIHTNIFESVVL